MGGGLEEHIKAYFTNLFSSTGCVADEVINCVDKRLNREQVLLLDAPFGKKNAKDVFFSMQPDKAPGKDGFNPCSFNIVGM